MYSFVKKEKLFAPQNNIERILAKLVETMKEKYGMKAHILLIGSGKSGLVTADETGHFDFDYNICFSAVPQEVRSNLRGLKDRVRSTFDLLADSEFCYGQGRKSVITFEHACENYSLDLGILVKNNSGQYCRLIYDKSTDRYFLSEIALLYNAAKKEKYVRQHCAWPKVESLYLKNKNKYPENDSFHIYLDVLNCVFNETGGQKMKKVSSDNHTQKQMDNHANQHNPNNSANRAAANNRANQLNPNNAAYWKSRGVK